MIDETALGDGGCRRRSTRDLAALLSAALDARVAVLEDGKRRRVSRRALIAAQLVDRSAQADLRATKLLVDLLLTIAPPAAELTQAPGRNQCCTAAPHPERRRTDAKPLRY